MNRGNEVPEAEWMTGNSSGAFSFNTASVTQRFHVLERTGLPSQTGHRGSQVILLPAGMPSVAVQQGNAAAMMAAMVGITFHFDFFS